MEINLGRIPWQKTSEEIESKYGVSVKYVVADFSEQGQGLYDRVKEEIGMALAVANMRV